MKAAFPWFIHSLFRDGGLSLQRHVVDGQGISVSQVESRYF